MAPCCAVNFTGGVAVDRRTVSLRSIATMSASQAEMCMMLSGKRTIIASMRDMRAIPEWVAVSVRITFAGTEVVDVEFNTVESRAHPWYGCPNVPKCVHDIKKIKAAFRKYLRYEGGL